MSEENDGQPAGEQEQSWAPPQSQDELNAIIAKRLERERAKFADYDALREKAAKFDEVQEASKSELQKAQERAEQAERRAVEMERTAVRARIAAEFNVPVEVLQGDDEESVRASAQKILAWRDSNKRPAPAPSQLRSGSAGKPESGSRAVAALKALRNQ